jgi:hypothetical protein
MKDNRRVLQLSCGNSPQTIGSAAFGPFCSDVRTQAKCKAQAPRCAWQNSNCAPAMPPPPLPPPPAPPGGLHPYTVGEAKFYGANLLCELDAPNEVRFLFKIAGRNQHHYSAERSGAVYNMF